MRCSSRRSRVAALRCANRVRASACPRPLGRRPLRTRRATAGRHPAHDRGRGGGCREDGPSQTVASPPWSVTLLSDPLKAAHGYAHRAGRATSPSPSQATPSRLSLRQTARAGRRRHFAAAGRPAAPSSSALPMAITRWRGVADLRPGLHKCDRGCQNHPACGRQASHPQLGPVVNQVRPGRPGLSRDARLLVAGAGACRAAGYGFTAGPARGAAGRPAGTAAWK